MTTPNPPVPSDEALSAIEAAGGWRKEALWLAGYHARDAETELAQHSAHQRGQTVAAQERRIAELEAEVSRLGDVLAQQHAAHTRAIADNSRLEAEVVELRKRAEKAEANYRFMVERAADQKLDGYRELAAKVADAENKLDAAPRRTPELTERVIAAIRSHDSKGPYANAASCAKRVLDLVFGKERE